MSADEFIGYVGDPDFHDGSLVRVIVEPDLVRVVLRGASGQEYVVEFRGGKVVHSNRPEGMMIYALTEMKARSPARRFVFANWEEDDDATLEVEAEDVSVTKVI
jgi:hypothetical protein